jgi:hypothetical protein
VAGTDDPLEMFIDRYIPRDLANVPGRYTVLRRQALRDLRALLAAECEACARLCDWWAETECTPELPPRAIQEIREIARAIRTRAKGI